MVSLWRQRNKKHRPLHMGGLVVNVLHIIRSIRNLATTLLLAWMVVACSDDKPAADSAALDLDKTRDIPLVVSIIKPNGKEQTEVTQIVIVFNKKMVPLGDMEKSAQGLPITITPAPECHWRWLNTTTLGCWLDKELPYSTAYSVTVAAGIKALDGSTLAAEHTVEFSTETLKLVRHGIEFIGPENPVITTVFNQPVDMASLKAAASIECAAAMPAGELKVRQLKLEEEDGRWDAKRTYRFESPANLAADRKCKLNIERSVKPTMGPLPPNNDIIVNFKTYPEFYVSELRCNWRNNTKGGAKSELLELSDCNPDEGVSLKFSVPTTNKHFAGKLGIVPQAGWKPGGYNSPEYMGDNPEEELQWYPLNSPFDGMTSYEITLADDLVDRFGRKRTGAKRLRFNTTHFKPSLSLLNGTAVIEKDGPHQLGYKTVNTSDFRLRLFAGQTAKDLDYIDLLRNYKTRCNDEADPDGRYEERRITTQAAWDQALTLPLDFEELLPQYDHGFFLGRLDDLRDMNGVRYDIYNNRPQCPKLFELLVTDLGLTAKFGYFNGGAWVHSIKSGTPLQGVEVQLLNSQREAVHSGQTDADGYVAFPGLKTLDPARQMHRGGKQRWYLVARTKDDFSYVSPLDWQRGIAAYEFGMPTMQLTKARNFLMQVITDRPLYKPGDEVRIKVFARQWDHESLKLLDPDERELMVEVKNYRGDKVLESTKVTLSDFSTGELRFRLPASAATGDYNISVSNKHGYTLGKSEAFKVEEYRLPPFEVKLHSPKDAYQVDELVPILGQVAYHFGGGLKDASGLLNATFQASRYQPSTPKYQSYTFGENSAALGWWAVPSSDRGATAFLRSNVKTDANGQLSEAIKLPRKVITTHGHVTIEAGFDDDSGKTIASRIAVTVHPTEFYLGLRTRTWSYAPEEDLGAKVIALNPQEQTLKGRNVKLTLLHRTYHTVRRRGAGNYFHYDTTTQDKEIASCEFKTSGDDAGCPLKPTSAGYYVVRAEASDKHGRKVIASLARYVTGPEYIGWWRQDHDRIDLIPDQPKYQLGDTLKVLVKSPYDKARALITLERHGLLFREERELVGGAQILEFPVDRQAYVPGFYLSVVLLKGRTSEKLENGVDLGKPSFKMGLIKIDVKDPQTRISIATKVGKKEYKPGETVVGKLQVKDRKGKGVEAEVALAVVDEALLQLVADYRQKYEVHDTFYKTPPLDVSTAETLVHLIGRRHYGKKGATAGGGGGEAASKLRQLFKAVAHWEPAILTDANGNASYSFKAPDNLTGWRIIAVAVDRNQRFGTDDATRFKVNKDLMLESALPNFITEGDELNARFVVHNRTQGNLKVDVDLKAQGLTVQGDGHTSVQVGKDDKTVVQFPLKAERGDKATVEIRAEGGGDEDGMRLFLPIAKFLSLETFATYGSTTEGRIEEALEIPPGIRTDVGGVDFLVSSSVLSHLDDTFKYVFNYPYGCWEQRLTRALMYRNNLELTAYLGKDARIPEKQAQQFIAEILDEASRFQTPRGGFAYWKPKNELADPYLSAYTALGFQWLSSSGFKADSTVQKKLNRYLHGLLTSDKGWPWYYTKRSKAAVRAIIAYVSGKRGDNVSSSVNKLYEERELLSLFGKGFLLMAIKHTPDAQTKAVQLKTLKVEIMNRSEITSGKMQFRESIDDGFKRILHSTTRTNCQLLTALAEVDSASPHITPLMRFIAATRRANRWNNTQENLFCLNGMIDYARIYEKEPPDFTVSGKLGEHDLGSTKFKGMDAKPRSLHYAFTPADPGRKGKLELRKEGRGRVYYTARLRFAYEQVRTDAVNAGMSVTRHYFVRRGQKWTPLEGMIPLKRGDLVRVQLKVGIPSERVFVALNDPLPAGLEPVNTALAAAMQADADAGESDNSTGSYLWNEDDYWYGAYRSGGFYHRELRLQAVQYFADFIAPGEYEMNYVAQAIATGKFSANPTIVEEMYDPEIYGKGVPAKFIIEEK